MPKQTVAYVRVSTGKQGRSGLGSQRERITQFAMVGGFRVVECFEEIESSDFPTTDLRQGCPEPMPAEAKEVVEARAPPLLGSCTRLGQRRA